MISVGIVSIVIDNIDTEGGAGGGRGGLSLRDVQGQKRMYPWNSQTLGGYVAIS